MVSFVVIDASNAIDTSNFDPDQSPFQTMKRLEALRAIYPELETRVVVTIMGAVAAELQSIGHRPNFFYLQHAMGLASSMGLGIALTRPDRQVVVFDGDGSVLMNLGGLTTLARYRPRNLVHVVFDNESLLSVGGFPTATSTGSDLAAIASAAGVPRTATVRTVEEFTQAFDAALTASDLTTLVAKVDAVGPSKYVTDLSLLENRFEFQRYLTRDVHSHAAR
jgi:sulfopyruvate decarboxylase subunit beta